MKINPVEILRSFPVAEGSAGDLAWDGNHLWLADSEARSISCLDATTGSEVRRRRFRSTPTGLTFGAGFLWMTDHNARVMLQMDQEGRDVLNRFPLPEAIRFPSGLGFDGKNLWQADHEAGLLCEIDPASGQSNRAVELSGYVSGVACRGDYLFFTEPSTAHLGKVTLATGKQVALYSLPGKPVGMTWEGSNLWYVDAALNQISQLRLLR